MEAVKKETFERNRAETIAKTLKETIEAQKELEKSEAEIVVIEDMVVDNGAEG